MALSSLSLTVLAWGAVCMQKDKGETPPACAHSGKELQGTSQDVSGRPPSPAPGLTLTPRGPVRARG